MTEPKVVTVDIESAPIEAYVWELFDQNIGLEQIKEDRSIISYCAKWLNSDELLYADTGGKGIKKVRDDSKLLKDLWKILDQADLVIGQNAISFDMRIINARLLQAGFTPYSPVRVIDTVRASRKHFGMTSNKLAWLSAKLTDTPKSEHKKFPGFQLWVECLADNHEAWEELEKYNKTDVLTTEKVYLAQRPWITQHPNVAAYNGMAAEACPKCGSEKVQKRGYSLTQNGRYARFQCQICGAWSRSKASVLSKDQRSVLLV